MFLISCICLLFLDAFIVIQGFSVDLSGRITKPTCVDIPSDLSLCQNIGYSQMRMPNLLDHDTLSEVKHQANSWVPLLLQRCHEDTQLFLCSLFAPVCLDRPIFPCRSLCEAVKSGCLGIMMQNCFSWPEMLQCDKFPRDNDLCIQSIERNTTESDEFNLQPDLAAAVGRLFTQCHEEINPKSLFNYYCNADFVLKMRIDEVKETKEGKKYMGKENKRKIYKRGSLSNKDLRKMIFWVREGANCRCDMLQPGKDNFLVMGHRDGKKLFMTFVHKWSKSRDFRRAIKMFNRKECPVKPGVN
ncbi:secreted frizzled-related protein 5-like isoform X2 [Amphiura filiformis]|uniref:secreted frizzled-related protein 5-like isoform X2 n=1 Tax=Amphiura filiformis TaxID=82378 RepID=UPI003B20E03C